MQKNFAMLGLLGQMLPLCWCFFTAKHRGSFRSWSFKADAGYWFSVGWDARDILQAANILFNSPMVLCVAIVARGQGLEVCRVLFD